MRGWILELMEYVGDDKKKQARYKTIEECQPHRMILLRELNDEQFLVAICKETRKANYIKLLTATNKYLYVNIRNFQAVDRSFCRVSMDVFTNPNHVVSEIYRLHNSWQFELNRKNKIRRKNHKREKRAKLVIPQKGVRLKVLNSDRNEEVPAHLQWAAKHPYQGGGFSGK